MNANAASTPGAGGSKGIGLVLALIVFVVLLFVVIGRSDKNTKVGVKELDLGRVDKEQVDKIEVTLPPRKPAADAGPASEPAKRVVLEKTKDGWRVFDPAAPDKKYAVDEGQLKSALDAIGELATGDLIANKKAKHAELEIDDEKGHAVKVTANGKTALDLVFGRPAKGGGTTVRQKGGEDVFVAKGRLGTVLKKEVGAWRKKTIFDVKADEITRVAMTSPAGERIVVEAAPAPESAPAEGDAGPAPAPKQTWRLVEPATLPAGYRLDEGQLARPASTIASLRAQDFADGATDAEAGFDAPHTIVEATTKDGAKRTVHLGKEDEKKRFYAKVDGDPQTYLVAAYTAKQLQRSLDDFRELTLVDVGGQTVERVTFKGSAGTIVVAQKDGAWSLVEPKAAPPEFEPSQIAGQVAAALRLRGSRVASDAPASAVAKAGPVIELVLADGTKQAVRFGAAVPPGDDGDKSGAAPREYFVKGAVDDLTYAIAAFTRNRYDDPVELFKKPPAPPSGMPGGMDSLPPDIRKKLEESLRKQGMPPGHP